MRWVTIVLVFVLVFPGAIFGNAGKPRGNKAVVYTAGNKYRGTLLYVDSELLVLKEKKSGEMLGFLIPQVERVYIRKSKAEIGVAAGLALGIGVIAITLIAMPKKSDNLGSALEIILLAGVVIGAALVLTVFTSAGGLLGSLLGWKRFKFFKMSAPEKEIALSKLQVYALRSEFPAEMRTKLVMVTN